MFAATAATAAAGAGTAAVAAPVAAGLGTAAAAAAPIAAATAAPAIVGGAGLSVLPSLSTIGTVASIGGTALGALGQMQQADYAANVAKVEAQALRQKANDEAAAGQRAAITNLRQAELVSSRARALGAASGTLATDPTQVDIEEDIEKQGRYNALSSLYEGLAASRATRFQSDIDLFKARRIRSAAPMAAFGTILSGVSGLASNSLRRDYYLGNLR